MQLDLLKGGALKCFAECVKWDWGSGGGPEQNAWVYYLLLAPFIGPKPFKGIRYAASHAHTHAIIGLVSCAACAGCAG